MSLKHILKLTDTEAVLKCYLTESAGGNVVISLSDDLTAPGQTYVANGAASVGIQEIFWGAKKDKQIDLTRIVPEDPTGVHGHYFLLNSGHYDFVGFVDDTYGSRDIKIVADGPCHVILKLRKTRGWTRS